MNELITVNDTQEQPSVSARDLHKGLEITERFKNWFDRQLCFGFIEGEDYVGCKVFNTQARQELNDFQISIDMAKQICMMQRSEKGKMYREYFLKIEKAWNSPEQVMARAMKLANAQIEDMQRLIEEAAPKIEFAEAVEESGNEVSVATMAKMITQHVKEKDPDFKIGQRALFDALRKKGILLGGRTDRNMPSQKYIDNGMFRVRVKRFDKSDKISYVPSITGKGQIYLLHLFSSMNARAG